MESSAVQDSSSARGLHASVLCSGADCTGSCLQISVTAGNGHLNNILLQIVMRLNNTYNLKYL
jgi:hypothetical protein